MQEMESLTEEPQCFGNSLEWEAHQGYTCPNQSPPCPRYIIYPCPDPDPE